MLLEELILKHLTQDKALISHLGVYEEKPAVFYQTAPDDSEQGWQTGARYPRLVYSVNMKADQDRGCAGNMEICLICDETGPSCHTVERLVRNCMSNILMGPDGGVFYCFSWQQSERAQWPQAKTGFKIQFHLFEYADQETCDPDPVMALNRWIRQVMEEALIIGLDHMGGSISAGTQLPVVYCRLDMVELAQTSNTVTWMDATIGIYVLCPSANVRLKYMMELSNALALVGEIVMLDGSPMRIQKLQVNNKADYLKEAQLFVTGRYGLLKYKGRSHMVTGVGMDYK